MVKKKQTFTKLHIEYKAVDWGTIEDDEDVVSRKEEILNLKKNLPAAPKSIRNEEKLDALPNEGPFVLCVSNIPHSFTEQDITSFFSEIVISQMTLLSSPRFNQPHNGKALLQVNSKAELAVGLLKDGAFMSNRRLEVKIGFLNDSEGGTWRNPNQRNYGDRAGASTSNISDDVTDWRSTTIRRLPNANTSQPTFADTADNWRSQKSLQSQPSRDSATSDEVSNWRSNRVPPRDQGNRNDNGSPSSLTQNWRSAAVAAAPHNVMSSGSKKYDFDRENNDRNQPRVSVNQDNVSDTGPWRRGVPITNKPMDESNTHIKRSQTYAAAGGGGNDNDTPWRRAVPVVPSPESKSQNIITGGGYDNDGNNTPWRRAVPVILSSESKAQNITTGVGYDNDSNTTSWRRISATNNDDCSQKMTLTRSMKAPPPEVNPWLVKKTSNLFHDKAPKIHDANEFDVANSKKTMASLSRSSSGNGDMNGANDYTPSKIKEEVKKMSLEKQQQPQAPGLIPMSHVRSDTSYSKIVGKMENKVNNSNNCNKYPPPPRNIVITTHDAVEVEEKEDVVGNNLNPEYQQQRVLVSAKCTDLRYANNNGKRAGDTSSFSDKKSSDQATNVMHGRKKGHASAAASNVKNRNEIGLKPQNVAQKF